MRTSLALRAAPLLLALWAAPVPAVEETHDVDPWEPVNRGIFAFNEGVDRWVLEPAARVWDRVAPDPLQHAVSDFFHNLRWPIVTANHLLQGKPGGAATQTGRFFVNATVGLGGLFDPATHLGLERHEEDFGQTLGVWGVGNGPYFVLPLLGPSTVRDAGGQAVDVWLAVTPFFVDQFILLGARTGEVVNARSRVLEEVESARESALDFYVFVRDAYLQQRSAEVADRGEMTDAEEEDLYFLEEDFEEEGFEEDEEGSS